MKKDSLFKKQNSLQVWIKYSNSDESMHVQVVLNNRMWHLAESTVAKYSKLTLGLVFFIDGHTQNNTGVFL